MSNGINFRRLALDLRDELNLVTAERDAALAEVERLKNIDHRQILADSAAKYLLDSGAENLIGDVFAIEADDGQTKFEVIVTTQKVGAKSPGELCSELQQRLTAADERADVLDGLLRTSLIAMKRIYQAGYDRIIDAVGTCDTPEYMMESYPTMREIRAALKPSDGGGDD